MALRTDKVSGIITCVFGCMMVAFGVFGLLIIALQRAMLAAMPPLPQNPQGFDVSITDAFHAIHGIWFIYLPIMILGGVVFAVSGFLLYRGSSAARRVAQANAVAGYAWLAAYAYSGWRAMPIAVPVAMGLPESVGTILQAVSILIGTLLAAAFPTALLWILSRPGQPAEPERNSPEKSAAS